MQMIFVTNYFNHHQAPLSRELDIQTGHQYYVIETMPMEEERKSMGWGQNEKPAYVLQSYTGKADMEKCRQLILEADVVIRGSCPFSMIKPRLRARKLTLTYSERIFKEGCQGFGFWARALKYFLELRPYQENHYLLCASGYAAGDYHRLGLFQNAAFRFGYFPEVKSWDLEALFAIKRKKEVPVILWAGRLIDWKHPEAGVLIAEKLKKAGCSFEMNIVGSGIMEAELQQMIADRDLSDCIHMLGSMPPEQVRLHMERSDIFLFSSDQNEGWGAVLNESMNSGCAVVASSTIGSVPFLIQDGENGAVFESGDWDSAFQKIAGLLEDCKLRKEYGKNAYHTISTQWNAQNAAQRLCTLAAQLEAGKSTPFSEGVCSKVEETTITNFQNHQ